MTKLTLSKFATMPALTVALLTSTAFAGGAGAPQGFRTVPCPSDIKANQCGYVKVPLNHAAPTGQQIELFVAVQKSAAPVAARQADPLFYLEGGPGAPSSLSVEGLGKVFANRDVIGVDQRGIGRSLPSLACPQVTTLMNRQDLKISEVSAEFSKALIDCGAALRAKGIQLEYFNTTQAAQDIDTVRRVLGYQKINLYGGSYGTRLAQEVMRRASSGLRAVVLDSVIPASVDRVARTPLAIQESAARIFEACQKDSACHTKYPNLHSDYQAVLKQLTAKPLPLALKGSAGELDAAGFQGMLLGSMYYIPGIQEFPRLIVAAKKGDMETMKNSTAAKFSEAAADLLTWQAFFTNECAGEVAYSSPAQLQAGLAAAPEFAKALATAPGISSSAIFNVCRGLRLTTPAPQENEPVQSSVPTLLIAGEFDPVTPPNWLPEAAQKLTHNQQVVINGASHAAGLTSECGYALVTAFLKNPNQPVKTECASKGKIAFK